MPSDFAETAFKASPNKKTRLKYNIVPGPKYWTKLDWYLYDHRFTVQYMYK